MTLTALCPVKFDLGSIYATPAAVAAINAAEQPISYFLSRHQVGDWGAVDQLAADRNARAVIEGTRIVSAYRTLRGERILIVTEGDRSATNVLLPREF